MNHNNEDEPTSKLYLVNGKLKHREPRVGTGQGGKWFNVRQLKGYRARVQAAVNACDDGAKIELDLTTGCRLLDIIDQTIHTEQGNGNT